MQPLVSIVIPAYNSSHYLLMLLEACLAQQYPNCEIMVVDDGSTDDTATIVTQFPVTYIYQPNQGPAKARNTGWQAAQGEIVCFTDADCVPAADWVLQLVKAYDSETVGGVGGTYGIVNKDSLLASCIHEEIVQRHIQMPKYVNYLGSFNASYRRVVLEKIGGFNEDYRIASGEDNDLAYSVIKQGYSLIFTQAARVGHHHPEKIKKYLRQQFWHGYWRMQIYRNHPDMARGDSYGGLVDFLQPPLAILTLGLLPFIFLPLVAMIFFALVIATFTLTLPMTIAIMTRIKQVKYLALAPITFVRAYARGIGLGLGVLKFFILERSTQTGLHTEKDETLAKT